MSDLNRSVISDDLMLPERKVPTSVQKLFSAEKPKMQTQKASRSPASTSQKPKKLWQLLTSNMDPFELEFSEIPEGLREFQFNKYYKKVMNNMNEPSMGPKVRDLEIKWYLDDIKRLKVYLKKENWDPSWQSYLGGKDYSDLLDEVSRLEKRLLKEKKSIEIKQANAKISEIEKILKDYDSYSLDEAKLLINEIESTLNPSRNTINLMKDKARADALIKVKELKKEISLISKGKFEVLLEATKELNPKGLEGNYAKWYFPDDMEYGRIKEAERLKSLLEAEYSEMVLYNSSHKWNEYPRFEKGHKIFR